MYLKRVKNAQNNGYFQYKNNRYYLTKMIVSSI